MWKWKLLFALMAVSRLVYASTEEKFQFPIDIRVTFEIDDSQTKAEGIAHLMEQLWKQLVSEKKWGVCCIWRKGNSTCEYPLNSSATATDIEKVLTAFLQRPKSVGRNCTRRQFTHYGEVVVETVTPEGNEKDKWTEDVYRRAGEEAKNTALAIVFLNDYQFDKSRWDKIWMAVVQSSDPTKRNTRFEDFWQVVATYVAIVVSSEATAVADECNYLVNRTSCYFSRKQRDQCLREVRAEPSRKQQWSPLAQKFCNDVPLVENVACNSTSDCDESCKNILQNTSCPCGGIWNTTMPKRFEHCLVTWKLCIGKPCPSPSSSPSLSVGALLMITGSVMFVLSGIGLIVFWIMCVKRGKTEEGSTKSEGKRRSKDGRSGGELNSN